MFKLCLLSLVLALPFSLTAADISPQRQFIDLAAANGGVIRLDETLYDLLASPKRNWSASVQFTAMDSRRRCSPCQAFDPAWNSVAKAWTSVPKSERDSHFFATLDFDNAQTVFQKLGLATAPVVYVLPATEGPHRPASGKTAPFKYDFTHGFEAGPLAEHLSHHTPVPIPYRAPIDWVRLGALAFAAVALVLAIRFVAPILTNRWTWAVGSVLISLTMNSGYMFTRIRGAPYSGADGQWVAQGYQNQFGQETQVVALIYALLATSFLMLIVVTPLQASPQRQRAQVYLWTAIIMVIYSILVSLFRMKNKGYPFKLFF